MSDLSKDLGNAKYSLGKIAELLKRNDIDIDEIGGVKKVSLYQSLTKNEAGEAEIHDLMGIQFSPAFENGPQWPVVQPGPSVRLPVVKVKPSVANGYQTCVILPDMQIGYFRDANGTLVPTQDENALEISMAIIKSVNPDLIVMVGDNLDFPEFGKYRLSPSYALTTQASIDRATTLCAQLRALAPQARIVWLAGNHEERLVNYVLDNAKASFGLKRGNTPESWPVLSIPYLCRFSDFGVEFVPGYPAGQFWVNQRLRVIHGTKVRSNGSTAHAYLGSEKTSVIYGHIHRREWAERSRDDWDGAKTIMAASPGTLARCDGAVPSTKGALDLDGRPMTIVEDWQQGIAVVTYQPGDGEFWYEQVPFHSGCAMYRGKLYKS
ncbi:Calcineurin-like phosphoesterase domain, lpxH type [uncultured Caudovirales phage]|uniref:Calcineurin-like phosphoesterase domain, lpxH type n=1 Tax=uncultured Caudovirales phage TaxID=2100421 RepID=A0A6J5N8Q6_9CAUD|nr:Calcineurin-like phosphoesterase domain, lpxH type [uncultured Caudovirales phage]